MIGVEAEQADIITDSILDWVDPDDLVNPFGAESEYYYSLPEPYPAKNGFFDVPEELLLVRGVTPEIYYGRKGMSEAGEPIQIYGLQDHITTFTNAPQINLNSAFGSGVGGGSRIGFFDCDSDCGETKGSSIHGSC